jgi:4-phytase/acid phosphatase
LLAALLASAASTIYSQTIPAKADDTVLKQIIIFSRHGIRSAALPNSTLSFFATRPYPNFTVPTGYLTPNGYSAEVLMGSYFRTYLTQQGLLTNDFSGDSQRAYFRANSIQRSNVSAAARWAGLFPALAPRVYSFPLNQPDAVFDPIAAKLVTVDPDRASAAVRGVFGSSDAVKGAYAAEFSLIRSILLNYPLGTQPPPAAPNGTIDATAGPIPFTLSASPAVSNVINAGPVFNMLLAADPFVMQYADGFALKDVAWGQLTPDTLSQQTRIISLLFNLEVTAPYLNELSSSNAASHILRTMEQAVTNNPLRGAFGDPSTKLVVVSSSDAYVVGVAGLLRAHWNLPGYQPDYCPPGGSLVFELRQSSSTGEYIVRVYFTAQTFDQLRNLTPLTASNPPATAQLTIPGGSTTASLDIKFSVFEKLMKAAINPSYVDEPLTEILPGILTGVPLN